VSAIPFVGDYVTYWLWGGYSVGEATLNRFFTFHFLLPFLLIFIVFLHILYLHEVGSSNKLLIILKRDKIFFQPYFTMKDLISLFLICFIFIVVVGFYPDLLGHVDNFVPADFLVTPSHIVPE
jgi:quinol-cytochrome oxidoreductase complex cytochrome b subunit